MILANHCRINNGFRKDVKIAASTHNKLTESADMLYCIVIKRQSDFRVNFVVLLDGLY